MGRKILGTGLMLLGLQFSAFAAQVAVLRNGFSIRFDTKEEQGSQVRLHMRGGFLDVAAADIVSIEQDDTPDPAPAAPVAQPQAPTIQSQVPAAQALVPVASAGASPVRPAAKGELSRSELDQFVRETSARYRLDPDIVMAVIKAESNFQARAVSPKGAQGLMQLMPQTASQLGVRDAFDPKANVEGGTAYLNQLLDLYHDDLVKALAAYNAGAHRVDRYHGVPPYRETQAYIARIVRDFNAKKLAQMKADSRGQNAGKNKPLTNTNPSRPQQASAVKPAKPA